MSCTEPNDCTIQPLDVSIDKLNIRPVPISGDDSLEGVQLLGISKLQYYAVVSI